ncbi:hypothetical protein N7530_000008 [Penicillium desertorum]|uniref:Fumarylacetoacetase-like C-terminal domain-containing protein n=1 Tax=Penicillium desertorum TaxID=1303715 RepID=A0A9W9X7D3_9EURO|nr:hypothetical protein N7530_000008 [Penicillium desertorum]
MLDYEVGTCYSSISFEMQRTSRLARHWSTFWVTRLEMISHLAYGSVLLWLGGQYCYAKGFDNFAPIGPTVRHPGKTTIDNISIQTMVNGERRQSTVASDMLFSPSKILEHLSNGCTVRKGTVVMTGTPSGIAGRMKGEPWLQDGDVVEVCISGIGKISNQMVMPCRNRL